MRYPRRLRAAVFALFVVVLSQVQTGRQTSIPGAAHLAAVILLGFHAGVTPAQRAAIVSATGGIPLKTIGAGTTVLYVGQFHEQEAINTLKRYREVRYAE